MSSSESGTKSGAIQPEEMERDSERYVRHFLMTNYPQDGMDAIDDDELSDEVLKDLSGGNGRVNIQIVE